MPVSIADQMARLRKELREIARDMRSISPKLALYKHLADRHAVIIKELEQLGAQRTAKK